VAPCSRYASATPKHMPKEPGNQDVTTTEIYSKTVSHIIAHTKIQRVSLLFSFTNCQVRYVGNSQACIHLYRKYWVDL